MGNDTSALNNPALFKKTLESKRNPKADETSSKSQKELSKPVQSKESDEAFVKANLNTIVNTLCQKMRKTMIKYPERGPQYFFFMKQSEGINVKSTKTCITSRYYENSVMKDKYKSLVMDYSLSHLLKYKLVKDAIIEDMATFSIKTTFNTNKVTLIPLNKIKKNIPLDISVTICCTLNTEQSI